MEQVVSESAAVYDKYEELRVLPAVETERESCVISADGKGVPVLAGENPNSDGRMKEALVASIYTVNSHIRSAEEVAYSLTSPELLTETQRENLRDRDGAQNIHYRASLEKTKEEVFKLLVDEVEQRSGDPQKTICLFDGAPILWRLGREHFSNAVYILDIIHVLDYLWDAVHVFEDEKTSKAEAMAAAYLKMILDGKVGYAIGALRQRLTKNKLTKADRKTVEKAITYYENHRDYIDSQSVLML